MTHFQLAIEWYFVHNTLHQSGFSLSILTHESYFFASFDGEIDVTKDGVCAVFFLHFVANNGIVATAKAWGEL